MAKKRRKGRSGGKPAESGNVKGREFDAGAIRELRRTGAGGASSRTTSV